MLKCPPRSHRRQVRRRRSGRSDEEERAIAGAEQEVYRERIWCHNGQRRRRAYGSNRNQPTNRWRPEDLRSDLQEYSRQPAALLVCSIPSSVSLAPHIDLLIASLLTKPNFIPSTDVTFTRRCPRRHEHCLMTGTTRKQRSLHGSVSTRSCSGIQR